MNRLCHILCISITLLAFVGSGCAHRGSSSMLERSDKYYNFQRIRSNFSKLQIGDTEADVKKKLQIPNFSEAMGGSSWKDLVCSIPMDSGQSLVAVFSPVDGSGQRKLEFAAIASDIIHPRVRRESAKNNTKEVEKTD